MVFTLIDGGSIAPLAERKIDSPSLAGIQRLRLDRLGVELRPGIDYEWSITLVGAMPMPFSVATSRSVA